MDARRWAILLDDEGATDAQCRSELGGLVRALVSARSDAPPGTAPRAPPGLPAGISMEDYLAAFVEKRRQERVVDVDAGAGGDADCDADDAAAESARRARLEEEAAFDHTTREPLRDMSALAVWTVSTAKPGNGVEQLLDPRVKSYWQSDGQQPHTISAQFPSKLKLSEVWLYLDFAQDDSYTPAILSIRVGSSFHDLRYVRRNKEVTKPNGWVRIPLSHKGIAAQKDYDDVEPLPSEEDDVERMAAGEIAERDQRRAARAEHRRRYRAQERRASTEKRQIDDLTAASRVGEASPDDAILLREIQRRKMRDATFVRAHMLQIVIHTNHQNGRDSHVRRVKVMGPAQQVSDQSSRFSSVEFQKYETIR